MNHEPSSPLALQLWHSLPEVYRTRDGDGSLAAYLEAYGRLLDLVEATLVQRLRDSLPDTSQPWLLPYFAALVDARLVSPEITGQREEVANAVAWRQSKGTIACIEAIAERVGQMEVEIQEGWQRVARTVRIDRPLLDPQALGHSGFLDMANPLEARKHPGLPAVSVDLGVAARARQVPEATPVSRRTRFGETSVLWQHGGVHGTPCFPDSFEDVSRRTVDFRTPNVRNGRYHPKRLLLFAAPPPGFFRIGQRRLAWVNRLRGSSSDAVETIGPDTSVDPNGDTTTVTITRVEAFEERHEVISHADGRRTTRITFRGRTDEYVVYTGRVDLQVEPAEDETVVYRFEHLILWSALVVTGARVELIDTATRNVLVSEGPGGDMPLVRARDSLIRYLRTDGLAELEYCTVVLGTVSPSLRASDCVLTGYLRAVYNRRPPPNAAYIRYSCIPTLAGVIDFSALGDWRVYEATLVTRPPVLHSTNFGAPGYGVLHTATGERVCFGAEDGGEMGAFHGHYHCLRERAMTAKLADFLPVGIEPVLTRDERLTFTPPSALVG